MKDGVEQTVIFDGQVNQGLPGAEENVQRYLVYLTYTSKVEFSPTVCARSGQYSFNNGCKVGVDAGNERPTAESFTGQGAPIVFDDLLIIPLTGQDANIRLEMKVADRGRGNWKSAWLGRTALGGIPLQCEFKGKEVDPARSDRAIFKEKSEIDLICTGKFESRLAYETPLLIELFYDYELTESRSLEIRG